MTSHGAWRRTASGAGLLADDGTLRPTIFAEMSALAQATGAINLGQGFPDEDGPAEVLEAAREAIAAGVNQYPPGRGHASLRAAIARHQRRFYGLEFDPDREVLVTAGATEALTATILALTDHDDEVVTLEPFYDSYAATIALAGARHITVPLRGPRFEVDHDELRRAVTDRTRLILINSPHNPTGAVLDRATLDLVVELAHRHDALILTDEVYEHITFGGTGHTPIATLPGARERTITVSSGGKTFNTTGWKIGWLTAPAVLVDRVLTVKQFLTYVNGAPFQPAIAVGLGLPDAYFHGLAATLERRAGALSAGLASGGLEVRPTRGSYFVLADPSPLGHPDAVEFCRLLPAEAGVVAIPVSAFVTPARRAEFGSLVRFAFCKRDDVLAEAVDRLVALRA